MSEDLVTKVSQAVTRIVELPLEEQPQAFIGIRDELEAVLNGAESTLNSDD